MMDIVVLGSVCCGYCGSSLNMLCILWFLARYVVDIVVLGLVCGGYCGYRLSMWWILWF